MKWIPYLVLIPFRPSFCFVKTGLFIISLAAMIQTTQAGESLLWDDLNSRVWTVGAEAAEDTELIDREWIVDEGRTVLRLAYTPSSDSSNFLLVFTNLLAPESLDDVEAFRVVLKWDVRPVEASLKIEGKGLAEPYESSQEFTLFEEPFTPSTSGYQEYVVPVASSQSLSRLILVLDNVANGQSELFIDSVSIVRNGQERIWDAFDSFSRLWVPFGAWLSWAGPDDNPALELINSADVLGTESGGGLFLRWDTGPDARGDEFTESAEIKTEGNTLDAIDAGLPPPGLNEDFSAYDRISADVLVTNTNPIGVFFGTFEDGRSEVAQGFITPSVRAREPGVEQRMSWAIPWPPGFPRDNVDVVAFVVRDVLEEGQGSGDLWVDNIELSSLEQLEADRQGSVWHISHYDFDAHGDNDALGTDPKVGFLGGNSGEFSPDDALTRGAIRVGHVTNQSDHDDGRPGGSLGFEVNLEAVDFAGEFMSVIGHSEYREDYTLDLSEFSQVQLSLRAAGSNIGPVWVKLELKDARDSNDFTAYRYVELDPNPSSWTRVVLDADLSNQEQWFYHQHPPDPTQLKFLVLVGESFFNEDAFSFYLDEIRLIHQTETPLASSAAETALDEVLERVQFKTWLHFDRWVVNGDLADDDLYLFLDRSTFPDLVTTAGAGFGLGAIIVAHHNGWIDDEEAVSRTLRVLRTYAERPMIDDPTNVPIETIDQSIGVKGWFWHFLDRDGTRKSQDFFGAPLDPKKKSELSSVDTAIFLWGALAAKAYFNSEDLSINPAGVNPAATEIASLVDFLYSRVDFGFLRRIESVPENKQGQIYLGWKPEKVENFELPVSGYPEGQAGYYSGNLATENQPVNPHTWNRYTDETLMILLLGAASPNEGFRLPAEMLHLNRYFHGESPSGVYDSCEGDHGEVMYYSFFGSAFTYFFLQSFFRAPEELTDVLGVDVFANARHAAKANWLFCRCLDRTEFPTFSDNLYGLTAAEGRDGNYHGEWGAEPRESLSPATDGTLPPYGALGFMAIWEDDFSDPRVRTRNPSTDALLSFLEDGRVYNESMGFVDAYNLIPEGETLLPFYNYATFAIDQGPILLGIENERSQLFWRLSLLCDELEAADIVECDPVLNIEDGRESVTASTRGN